jgi:hypothetical protein
VEHVNRLAFVVRRLALIAASLGIVIGMTASCSSSGSASGAQQLTDAGSDAGSDSETGTSFDAEDDASAADAASADTITTCPSFSTAHVACSMTCYGNCVGSSGDVGDCTFTRTGNILVYCTPWDAGDPCSTCRL